MFKLHCAICLGLEVRVRFINMSVVVKFRTRLRFGS